MQFASLIPDAQKRSPKFDGASLPPSTAHQLHLLKLGSWTLVCRHPPSSSWDTILSVIECRSFRALRQGRSNTDDTPRSPPRFPLRYASLLAELLASNSRGSSTPVSCVSGTRLQRQAQNSHDSGNPLLSPPFITYLTFVRESKRSSRLKLPNLAGLMLPPRESELAAAQMGTSVDASSF